MSEKMEMIFCTIFQAKGDVDMDIAKAAVYSAQEHSTTLIWTDEDLFFLLLYYAELNGKPLYF